MLSFFLARRFHQNAAGDRTRRASRLAIRIATAGVAVGLAVMIVSVAVVKGFQSEVSDKLTGFSSHLMVMNDSSFASPQSYPIVTDSVVVGRVQSVHNVAHVQRVANKMGILKTDSAYQTICLKGIGPEYDTGFMRRHLIQGRWLSEKGQNAAGGKGEVVISQMMADALGLKVGSKVFAYFFEQTIKMRRMDVVGIYDTHMSRFDRHYVLTDLATVQRLNGWDEDRTSMLEIYLDDFERLDSVQVALAGALQPMQGRGGATYVTMSVKEHPYTAPAFAWLGVLDLNVWVILVLMMGVAGFTMISGLLILILERSRTIGVLGALGASGRRIRHTFILYAAMIVGRGLLWGNLLGLSIVLSQYYFGWATLDPENYYVDTVPVLINVWWIVELNLATFVVTVLSLFIPSLVISHIQPAKVIRYE